MVKVEGGRLKAAKKSVKDFKIGKYEVTKGEWQEVANWATANGYDLNASGCNPGDTTPVGQVSWYDIVKWCNAKSEMERLDPVYYVKGKVYKTGIFGNENWDIGRFENFEILDWRVLRNAVFQKSAVGKFTFSLAGVRNLIGFLV